MLWAVGAITSLMTAFYMFRLVFLAFHGERRQGRAEAQHFSAAPRTRTPHVHHTAHLHDAPRLMAIALVVLAIGSVLAGYVNVPAAIGGSARLEHFLDPSLHVPVMRGADAAAEHADHAVELILMAVSSLLALTGIGIAAFLYLKRPEMPDAFAARFPGAYQFLVNKGNIDEMYDALVVQPIKALSEHVLWKGDARVIDGAVNGAGQIVVETGSLVRQIQTGSVRTYAVSVLFGAVVIVGYYLWS